MNTIDRPSNSHDSVWLQLLAMLPMPLPNLAQQCHCRLKHSDLGWVNNQAMQQRKKCSKHSDLGCANNQAMQQRKPKQKFLMFTKALVHETPILELAQLNATKVRMLLVLHRHLSVALENVVNVTTCKFTCHMIT